mgnify:CR=1 FL=1
MIIVVVAFNVLVDSHPDIQQKRDAYQLALTSLRDDPTNTTLQEQAWSLGRTYVASTQNVKGVIPFTEEMLANNIETIIANTPPKPPPVKKDKGTPPVLSLDDRINALIQMRDSNLLSDTEFEQKRKEILDSI